MDSSSSEDDEFTKRLQGVVNDAERGLKSHTGSTASKSAKPSLRHHASDDSDDGGDGVSSAGFKAHMSKKLSAFLDGMIDEVSFTPASTATADVDSSWSGLKIYSCSDGGRVRTRAEVEQQSHDSHQKRRRKPSVSSGSEDDDDELQRLALAAVSGELIVENGELKCGISDAKSGDDGQSRGDEEEAHTSQQVLTSPGADESCTKPQKRKKKKRKAEDRSDGEECKSDVGSSAGNSSNCDENICGAKKKKRVKGESAQDVTEAAKSNVAAKNDESDNEHCAVKKKKKKKHKKES